MVVIMKVIVIFNFGFKTVEFVSVNADSIIQVLVNLHGPFQVRITITKD